MNLGLSTKNYFGIALRARIDAPAGDVTQLFACRGPLRDTWYNHLEWSEASKFCSNPSTTSFPVLNKQFQTNVIKFCWSNLESGFIFASVV